jgi:hypothetical protein
MKVERFANQPRKLCGPIRYWSEDDYAFMNQNWQTMTDVELARGLNRTPFAVRDRRRVLGLHRPNQGKQPVRRSEVVIAAVKERWGTMRPTDIGAEIGVSDATVRRIAGGLGLPQYSGPYLPRGGNSFARLDLTPKGYSPEEKRWALANYTTDKEAAMILAHLGKDVRRLGWR